MFFITNKILLIVISIFVKITVSDDKTNMLTSWGQNILWKWFVAIGLQVSAASITNVIDYGIHLHSASSENLEIYSTFIVDAYGHKKSQYYI